MRTNGTLNYVLGDHLGSTSLTTNSSGQIVSQLRYKAWGEERYASGPTSTNYTYTGQYSYADDFGLMYYGARWYDSSLGRFNQPDTIIPPIQGVQAWDRYAYSNNNPVKYTDPSGHFIETAWDFAMIGVDLIDIAQNGLNWSNGAALAVDVASAIIPGIPAAGGVLLKTAKAANALDNAVDTANAIDTAVDAGNSMDNLADSANTFCLNSFSAETDVATLEGTRDIATIAIGDYVLAWNETDNSLGFYPVTATIHHKDEIIINLIMDGEWIETTPEHPFYVEGKGWVDADHLRTGDQVRQADGTTGFIWLKWSVYKTQEMYNLTVDTAHTFFVGEGQWLVHNECFPYKDRADYLLPGQQANHLNQNAAFESVIPRDEGASIALYGNAITDIGSEHYVFHQVMERFWEIYRSGSEVGNIPTIRQYSSAMELALQYAGLSNRQIAEAVAAARKNRQMFGLRDLDLVPRIPGRLHQVR